VRHLSLPAGLLAIMAFAAASTLSARAGTPAIVMQALQTTMKTSYHMTMVSPQTGAVEADVVPPSRMHLLMKKENMEAIVIDSTMYMKQNGTWKKYPGVDIMKMQTLQSLAASTDKFTVDDLGPKLIDGALLHAYRTTNLKTKTVASFFLDGSGRIARMEVGSDVIQFSKFGETVTITAPM
jgi:hypothetical protein